MYYNEEIRIYKKSFSLYRLYQMFCAGELICEKKVASARSSTKKQAAKALDILLMAIPYPTVYLSELQDGSYLLIESKDMLLSLLQYVDNHFACETEGYGADYTNMFFRELEGRYPAIASSIMNSEIDCQIIDYGTPRYLHMKVGYYLQEWSIAREQRIWNVLYDGIAVVRLEELAKAAIGYRSSIYIREAEILRIMLVQYVAEGRIQEDYWQEGREPYFLIEQIWAELKCMSENELYDWEKGISRYYDTYYTLGQSFLTRYDGKSRFRLSEHAYMFYAWIRGYDTERMFDERAIWRNIEKRGWSLEGIQRNLDDIQEAFNHDR